MESFITDMKFLTSQNCDWWIWIMCIIVMFLSAVSTLIPTAPIHFRGSIGEQVK